MFAGFGVMLPVGFILRRNISDSWFAKGLLLVLGLLIFYKVHSQQQDSTGNARDEFSIGGYIDTYYAWDVNEPDRKDIPYFNSSQRHNEFSINLAYVDLNYNSERLRARFVPAFGSFMNSNYATETGTLKDLLEARVGVKLFKNRAVWLDAGVLGSPFTNESCISKDQLMYTRSLSSEYTPYYLSGVRLSIPVSPVLITSFYVINGWQQIVDLNHDKSVAVQFELKPSKKWLWNWNVYYGNHQTIYYQQHRNRLLSDVYFVYNSEGKFSATACVYGSLQEFNDTLQKRTRNLSWGTLNLIGRYRFNKALSLSARAEYFTDEEEAEVKSITNEKGFNIWGYGLTLNYAPVANTLIRLEQRSLIADKKVFDHISMPSATDHYVVVSMTAWF